jgi:hypothetical protein
MPPHYMVWNRNPAALEVDPIVVVGSHLIFDWVAVAVVTALRAIAVGDAFEPSPLLFGQMITVPLAVIFGMGRPRKKRCFGTSLLQPLTRPCRKLHAGHGAKRDHPLIANGLQTA